MPGIDLVSTLRRNPESLPEWLQRSRPKFDRKKFFGSRTIYYPGSRCDIDPLKVCTQAHAAHAFIYVDNDETLDIHGFVYGLEELGFIGYEVEYTDELTNFSLLPNGWTSHVHKTDLSEDIETAIEADLEGLFVVLSRDEGRDERHGPKRFAFLYVMGDGHITYDAFYCQDDGSPPPHIIVVQDHALSTNHNWFGHGGLLERLAYQRCRYPEWLLVGSVDLEGNSYEPWDGYADKCVQPERQGEAGNPRKLYRLNRDCPLFSTRQSHQTWQNATAETMTRPTLKHEVYDILQVHGNDWMRLRDIADLVNDRALYQRSNGLPVTHDEVFETWNCHNNLFDRAGNRIRCNENE